MVSQRPQGTAPEPFVRIGMGSAGAPTSELAIGPLLSHYSLGTGSRQTFSPLRLVSHTDPCPMRMLSPPSPCHCPLTALVAGSMRVIG